MEIYELMPKKERNPLSVDFIKENADLMKKLGIDKTPEKLSEDLKGILSRLSTALVELNNIDKETELFIHAIARQKVINQTNLNKISKKYKNLVYALSYLISMKKESDFYVATNFSSDIIRKLADRDINSLEDLIILTLDLKNDKAVREAIKKMAGLDEVPSLKNFSRLLTNSDQITQHIFVKYLLPSIISCAVSNEEIEKILDALKTIATAKMSHKEFYNSFNNIRLMLYMFGYSNIAIDYLRCFE